MERFRREAAVMGRLRHPNIVALYRFYDGNPAALVMEYVPGQTLAALVAADGWLPPPAPRRSLRTSPPRWTAPTRRASFIGMSSRPTSCFPVAARPA